MANLIKGKYKVQEIVKNRNYKEVIKCIKQDGAVVFIKCYSNSESKLIQNQIQIYQKLKQPHLHGFPEIKQAFEENGKSCLVIEQLGENIQTLRQRCGGRLSLKTTLMIGIQMLQRIQYLHSFGFLHGDIKPSNFLIGKRKMSHKIFLTDFQLSGTYLKNGKHIGEDNKTTFNGSLRFCARAINNHLTMCRRDEIESLYYSLIFLLKGELPWIDIKATDIVEANNEILLCKNKKREQLLSGLPDIFNHLFERLDETKFSSAPDYDFIRQAFQNLMKKNGYETDYKYDWQFK